jgi:hypothetical protein
MTPHVTCAVNRHPDVTHSVTCEWVLTGKASIFGGQDLARGMH